MSERREGHSALRKVKGEPGFRTVDPHPARGATNELRGALELYDELFGGQLRKYAEDLQRAKDRNATHASGELVKRDYDRIQRLLAALAAASGAAGPGPKIGDEVLVRGVITCIEHGAMQIRLHGTGFPRMTVIDAELDHYGRTVLAAETPAATAHSPTVEEANVALLGRSETASERLRVREVDTPAAPASPTKEVMPMTEGVPSPRNPLKSQSGEHRADSQQTSAAPASEPIEKLIKEIGHTFEDSFDKDNGFEKWMQRPLANEIRKTFAVAALAKLGELNEFAGFDEWWSVVGIHAMPRGDQPPEHAAIARLAWKDCISYVRSQLAVLA